MNIFLEIIKEKKLRLSAETKNDIFEMNVENEDIRWLSVVVRCKQKFGELPKIWPYAATDYKLITLYLGNIMSKVYIVCVCVMCKEQIQSRTEVKWKHETMNFLGILLTGICVALLCGVNERGGRLMWKMFLKCNFGFYKNKIN